MRYVFDLDGTLCTNTNGKYLEAIPMPSRIYTVNKLYDEGNIIVVCTARGMGQFSGDRERAYETFYAFTANQLANWGIKYHELSLGKPSGDIYVDDKGTNADAFFAS